MKECPICNQQCDEGDKVCPICGFDFKMPQEQSGGEIDNANTVSGGVHSTDAHSQHDSKLGQSGINMGNANAVSGGVHSTDDHSQHDSNNQTNSNNASNSYNTTNNTTINEAQKSESELLNENKLAYRLKCKELFEDGLISSNGESQLRELQVRLNLADEIALPIKDEIRLQSKKRKKKITITGLTDIRQTKSIIELNTVEALQRQLLKLESLMENYDDDSLKQVYYQMSSMLEPVRYADRYEKSDKYEYWETYWAYVAYLLQRREKEAYDAFASLGRWHKYYPEQNDVILHIAGRLIQNDSLVEVQKERNSLSANYTSDLQLLLDAIDELLSKDWEQESVLVRPVHTFYVKTLFADFFEAQRTQGLQALKERKEREERERKEREERERREREERERKEREERERKEREEREERERKEREEREERERREREERECKEREEREERERREREEREERERKEREEREERERKEREKRERRDRVIAWFERNVWYVLGGLVLIVVAISLCIYVPSYRQKKEEEQKQIELFQKQQSSYEELSKKFCEQVSSISFEKALNAVDAYGTLCEMHDIEKQYPNVKSLNNITFSSGKSLLLLKSDSILRVLESAEEDVFCAPEDKDIIKKKIIKLEQIKSDLQ